MTYKRENEFKRVCIVAKFHNRKLLKIQSGVTRIGLYQVQVSDFFLNDINGALAGYIRKVRPKALVDAP